MNLSTLFEMDMHYTWVDFVDYGAGGQYVGTLEGVVRGERLNGTVRFVNVPAKRPDNVNCPTFRGVLSTSDGAKITPSSTASLSYEKRTMRACSPPR